MHKLLICFLLFATCLASLRFRDTAQLQRHHNHTLNTSDVRQAKLQTSDQIIKVHLIAHSHDDVGWLKTVDEYYYGQHNNIQWAGVQYIIDSYVFSLLNDPSKKFIQVETAFFKKWWDEQNEHMKDQVRGLVNNGQLEFINGGWCMNDEATTYYEDIIDQMTLGHKFIFETFGVRPTIGWHIDPFGHQSAQASIFSQMGFNGWFVARIDYQDKENRLRQQSMEMVMRPYQQSGEDNSIFTHVNYYNYAAPPGFDFSTRGTDQPIIDDINAKDYNVKVKADEFANYFRNQVASIHYKGNIVMHTIGEDFQFDAAPIYFKNIDKLINYINTRPEYQMEIIYSTPREYLDAIHKEQQTYPTKDDDFFPYADLPNAYWTGYFTSRVAIKGLTRYYGRYSQVVHKLISSYLISGSSAYISQNKQQVLQDLVKVDEAMAILQHHDAVAGTEKQHVNNDYIETLVKSIDQLNIHVHALLSEISAVETNEVEESYTHCLWNTTASACDATYKDLQAKKVVKVSLIDGKPQQQGKQDRIRIKVPDVPLRVIDQNNNVVNGEVLCLDEVDKHNCDLYFIYTVQNPKTIQYFKLVPTTSEESSVKRLQPVSEEITEDQVQIQLGSAPSFKLHYGYYKSYQGVGQKSGAYIFRPEGATDQTIPYGKPLKKVTYKGDILNAALIRGTLTRTVVRQFNVDWLSATYEVETFIDSIPIADGVGKEVVLQLETGINNKDVFYTDSNGLELQRRQINYRPTWDLEVLELASGNYYPINGMILVQDETTKDAAVLLNDRSQGGSSLRNGQIEVMIHRRLLMDDSRGVGEPLNELEAGDGLKLNLQSVLHTLSFFNLAAQPNHHRKLQLYQDYSPHVLLSGSETPAFKIKPYRIDYTQALIHQAIDNELLKIYLQPWNQNTYLFRIQNMQEQGDIPLRLPKEAKAVETILTGTQTWKDWIQTKLDWAIDGEQASSKCTRDYDVVKPLQIRTFILSFPEIEDNIE